MSMRLAWKGKGDLWEIHLLCGIEYKLGSNHSLCLSITGQSLSSTMCLSIKQTDMRLNPWEIYSWCYQVKQYKMDSSWLMNEKGGCKVDFRMNFNLCIVPMINKYRGYKSNIVGQLSHFILWRCIAFYWFFALAYTCHLPVFLLTLVPLLLLLTVWLKYWLIQNGSNEPRKIKIEHRRTASQGEERGERESKAAITWPRAVHELEGCTAHAQRQTTHPTLLTPFNPFVLQMANYI